MNYPTPPPRLRSSQPAENISGFFKIVNQALQTYAQLVKTPPDQIPVFIESSPKERLTETDAPFGVITFRVQEAHMAAMDNAGKRIPRGFTTREIYPDSANANYSAIEAAWVEEVFVVFEIWSSSNSNANIIARWFHEFIYIWANAAKIFEARGISQFRFEKRLQDRIVTDIGTQEIYLRELMYSFRIENLVRYDTRTITDITLNIDFPAGSPPINLTSD